MDVMGVESREKERLRVADFERLIITAYGIGV